MLETGKGKQTLWEVTLDFQRFQEPWATRRRGLHPGFTAQISWQRYLSLAGRCPRCAAHGPHQFPHSYIRGMSCSVLHLPGIFRETQDRRTCKDLFYKQWKHRGGTEGKKQFQEGSGQENVSKKTFRDANSWLRYLFKASLRIKSLSSTPCPLFVFHLHILFLFLVRAYFCVYVIWEISISLTVYHM